MRCFFLLAAAWIDLRRNTRYGRIHPVGNASDAYNQNISLSNNKNLHIERSCAEKEPSINSDQGAKEGSGEVTMTAPTPEQKWIDVKNDGFGENYLR